MANNVDIIKVNYEHVLLVDWSHKFYFFNRNLHSTWLCPFHSFSSFLMQWERRSHNRLVNFNSFVYPFLLYFFEIPIHLAISMYIYLHLLIHIMERLTKGLAYMNMSVTSMFLFPFETYIVTIKSVGGFKTPNFQS